MTLIPGTRLGVYEVTAKIGEGGMGHVYRATDTTLGRQVAIKILPHAFAADPDALARFEREAKTLASLNHPHIAAIYGFEKSGGLHALVMELVEGDDLSQRIGRGAIPIDEALSIAKQIAEGLEAAHEQGIIHRDLKPANIKIRADGAVKVLDFGLAKVHSEAPAVDLTNAPTQSAGLTEHGVLVGTAPYMSPEQARGLIVDKRTDIWAFGCVLYEMLAGRLAFAGATVSDTLVAILEREPDWRALPAATPSAVRRLMTRCLQKDAKRRLRDIGDARMELAEVDVLPSVPAVGTVAAPAAVIGARRLAIWSAAVLLLVLAGVVAWRTRSAVPAATQPVARLTIPLPEGEQLADMPGVAISPDGAYVAYDTARPGGGRRLYLRALSGVDAKVVSETSVGSWFFSPDSEWLGFFEAGKMKKVPVRGGPSQTIADASSARGASWGEDGFIVFAPSSRVALSRVSANGGAVQTLTTLDESRGETSHRYPTLLPGGRAVVYRAEGSTYADGAVVVYSLDTKQQRVLVADGGSQPRYSPTGHLLYLQAGSLMAARFDIDRLELTGPPTELIEGAQTFGLSNTGSLVYEVVGERARSSLVWVDRRGIVAPLPLPSGSYQHPRVSPDGRRIVFSILNGADRNLWTYDIGRDVLKKLTIAGSNLWPVWTTDGSRVVYASNKVGTAWDIFQRSADGSGTEESLLTKPGTQVPRAMSPNGEWVAFTQDEAAGQNLWLLPMKEKSVPRPFTNTKASETEPAFSPDGRWIAYMTNESSGRDEVYVRPVDGAGKWPISTDGGSDPVWNPSGHELFYRDGVKLYAVEVSIGSRFVAGKRRLLFEGPYALGATGGQNYDISPDGKRFVMMNPERSVAAPWQLNIVTNWFEELKRQVPAAH